MPTIFLLEKDPDILFVMDYWFSKEGYTVYSFSSKERLMEAMDNLVPDVILLDAHAMIKMGNSMLSRELKSRYSFHNKILLLSPSDIKEEELGLYDADGIIHKPFDLNELSAAIRAAL